MQKGMPVVRLKNLSPGSYRLATYQIAFGQNDPYSRYLEMGSPSDLSREAVAELKNLSAGKPISRNDCDREFCRHNFETTLPLREDDVYFLSLSSEQKHR